MARSEKVFTPRFRVSFPWVFRPRANQDPSKAPKFSINALFEPDADLSALKTAASQAVKAEWGDNPPSNMRSPFKNQSDKAKYEGYEPGGIYITATAKNKPGLVDANAQPIIDESEFYAGCYAHMTVVAFTYGGPGVTPGVAFGIQNIQKLADGDRLGGGASAEDDFGPAKTAAPAATGAQKESGDGLPW